MTELLELKSCLSFHLQRFLDEKHSQGYSYETETYWLKQFDNYWFEHNYQFVNLTQESLEDWIQKRNCEGKKCQATRISVIREFSFYLNGLGIYSYIPLLSVHYNRPDIHILSDEEIEEVFYKIDHYVFNHQRNQNRLSLRFSWENTVIFRLIFSCGLRISEACNLSVEDVDFDKGILTIGHSKGDKDRLVYLAEDMRQLLVDYYRSLCSTFGTDQKWLFPGFKMDKHISTSSVRKRFRECWKQTSYAETCDKDPTVHSLRHTFVVKRMNTWMLQGLDLNVMIPYLCKYLGHKSINETYYYYHFVQESARIIHEKDTLIQSVLPEVRRR